MSHYQEDELDVESPEERLEEISETVREISRHLIGSGIQYMAKVSGEMADDDMVRIRNNVQYRADALKIQLSLLLDIQSTHNDIAESVGPHAPYPSRQLSREQFSMFDNIVFHSCSLFDYVGYLAHFLCGLGNQAKKSWGSVAKALRDDENEIRDCIAGPVIRRLDRRWVSQLFDYRADLIHYNARLGGVMNTADLEKRERVLKAYAPSRFVSDMSGLRKKAGDQHVTLRFAAFWLTEKTLDSVLRVLKNLSEVIENNRQIPRHLQPIKFSPPDEESDADE
ncbi:hypothetical protein [Salinibacter pepae]|uniref:hypothetical protein n=1 Tax=Salinibacter pepae TaxID=3040382 RepID=UPI0021E7F1FF|nr:hypothetical protein [Salinibacter pepae]